MSIVFYVRPTKSCIFCRRASVSRVSHCHTTSVAHPSDSSCSLFVLSRFTLASNFGRQYSRRDLGSCPFGHPCQCQKHPCTKIAFRYFGRTMSGLPGRSFRCKRKRYPMACRSRLTTNSGPVSLLLTACMMRRRCSSVRVSIF